MMAAMSGDDEISGSKFLSNVEKAIEECPELFPKGSELPLTADKQWCNIQSIAFEHAFEIFKKQPSTPFYSAAARERPPPSPD